jgi:DNA-binding CsgD family transcriptional regulator
MTPDEIMALSVSGKSKPAIAKMLNISRADVERALDEAANEMFNPTELNRMRAVSARKSEQIVNLYHERAMQGDCDSATIYLRAVSVLQETLGIRQLGQLNVNLPPPRPPSSTEEARNILDEVLHITRRERQLLDMKRNGEASADELTELRQLTHERKLAHPRPADPDDE